MTTIAGAHVVPIEPARLPQLAAADRGVADSLEAVLSENTKRTYDAQWQLFDDWCDQVGLVSLPAEPLTVARYLAARAGSGASIATLRLAASAIAKAHAWARLESPCRDPGGARLFEGMGTAPGQTPAPVRSPHRRRPGRDPPHRRPASQTRPRDGDARAGSPAGEV